MKLLTRKREAQINATLADCAKSMRDSARLIELLERGLDQLARENAELRQLRQIEPITTAIQ